MLAKDKGKATISIVIAICLLIGAEILLQVRAQIRYGQSIFNKAAGNATFEYDKEKGLLLLRKNALVEGALTSIKTNSLGLRSPEIPKEKDPTKFRIALLGASTVMGLYTRNNEDTWSYRLEEQLEKKFANVDVINAGIAGYTIDNQYKLFEKIIMPLEPDLVVWYAGFNDVSGYCKQEGKKENYSLNSVSVPKWSLLIDLGIKNTISLRTTNFESDLTLMADSVDLSPYENKVAKFFDKMSAHQVSLLTVTMARAFRKDMPQRIQEKLSESARYYIPCFDLPNLHDIYDLHNSVIANYSKKHGYPVLELDSIMPGGERYFGDATHFTVEGTKVATDILVKKILEEKFLD